MIENYLLHLFIMICIFTVLSMSMNLTIGYAGMLNLAHVAFYAIGAYTSALLMINVGVPFWIALVSGGLAAAFFGFLLSFPTIKMKGDYLVIGTLGFSIIVEAVLKNWTSLTRGPLGLSGIPKPVFFGEKLNTLPEYTLLALGVVILTYFVLKIIVSSPFGRVLRAVRDDEIATRTLGRDTFWVKAKALTLAAFFAGVAGSLYAHYITFIDPTSFTIMETVLILSMVLIGGTGSLWGSIAGAALLLLLPEPLRFFHLPSAILGGLRQAMYALLLILVIMRRPQGLIGEDTLHDAWHTIKRKVRA